MIEKLGRLVVAFLDAMLPPHTKDKPWCCKLMCRRKAEWDIMPIAAGDDPYDNTQSCGEHIGELLGDSELYELRRIHD